MPPHPNPIATVQQAASTAYRNARGWADACHHEDLPRQVCCEYRDLAKKDQRWAAELSAWSRKLMGLEE